MKELHNIDCHAEVRNLDPEEWIHRYNVERHLEASYAEGRAILATKNGQTLVSCWRLKHKKFHQFANGRRRKSTIVQLETDHGVITAQEDIMAHVIQFYKSLFGPVEQRCISL